VAAIELKYVNSFTDRHGTLRFYFRKGGKRIAALPPPSSPTFSKEYNGLLAEHAPHVIARQGRGVGAIEGTLKWTVFKYKSESDDWKKLKASSKEIYNRRLDYLCERYGAAELKSFTERGVRRIRNRLKEHPSVADAVVDMVGRLWRFAKEHLDMDDLGPNPATEVASIHTEHESHPAWPEALCEAFEKLSNPRLVRAYFLLRYTGQRRGDVAKMHRSQFDGTAISVVQEKTGTPCWIPAHIRLREHLAGTGIDGEFLLTSTRGGPFRATSLTTMICDACIALGFPGFSPHGLRHLAGAALAEAGCSMDEIMAVLGHLTEDEARAYVQTARRKVMAKSAMRKWEASGNE
jgi:integrase